MEKKTKKELKELRRMEKEAQRRSSSAEPSRTDSSENMKWVTLGVVALVIVGLFGFVIYDTMQRRASEEQAANQRVGIADTGWSKGATQSAQVTLVEFADLQCPGCRANVPLVEQAMQEYDGKLKFVFKHFPLTSIHKNAFDAARASEAAGKQGKFWEMHDLLFDKQDEWSALGASEARQKFTEYAQSLELNVNQFNTDFESDEVEQKVKDMQNEGINLGVMGTPTFFVNGKRVQSGDYSFIKTAIDAELNQQ